jgi:hypothetical protein
MGKQIRIQSDGLGSATVVTTPDGRQLHPTSAIVWIDAQNVNRVDLNFVWIDTDIHADVQNVTMVCPLCDHSHSHKCDGKL